MPVTFIVAYPKGCNANVDYYLNKHIPMVTSLWNDPKMLRWVVLTGLSDSDPYEVGFLATFETKEDLDASMASLGKEKNEQIFGDVKNFSTTEPHIWIMQNSMSSNT